MQRFKFRPQAALDLRRRRAEVAERDLAAANARTDAARVALDAARATCANACRQARDEQEQAQAIATLLWYQNWIAAQYREAAHKQEELFRRCDEARAALDKATKARVDVRVLERLRDRARETFAREAQRAEQKSIDWLAVLRTLALTREREEHT
ncbi:MAG: flagellar FliJ family protein [Acidobacteriota bacterium]